MRVIYAAPSCPSETVEQTLAASSFDVVFEHLRPLACHAGCLVSAQRCRASGQLVAVKSYTKHRLAGAAREQVDTEVHIHASLAHAHVAPLLLVAEDDRCLHIAVHWANGGDLRRTITSRMPERAVRDLLVTPLLQALVLLAQQGVVHRDIKPENVLLHDGRALLADFGMAVYGDGHTHDDASTAHSSDTHSCEPALSTAHSYASFSSEGSLTGLCSGTLDAAPPCPLAHSASVGEGLTCRRPSAPTLLSSASGTPWYTAPEVLRAVFRSQPVQESVSHKNDVWAVGVMALEALLGYHPFSPSSLVHPNSANLLAAVAGFSGFQLPSSLSPEAISFVAAATHADPALRHSAAQLLTHPWLRSAAGVLTHAAPPVGCGGEYASAAPPPGSPSDLRGPSGTDSGVGPAVLV